MIIITGRVGLKPEHRDAAFGHGTDHSARSRREDGCLSHNCYIDAEDKNVMHFFEQWRDMAAVQQHFAVPESTEFVQTLAAMATEKPQILIFNAEKIETGEG